jgi:hypothetical protein
MEGPDKSKRLLTPPERVAEILFGLIMTLTFTCSTSIADTGRMEIRQLLIGALSCNLAWGIVDGIMYLTDVLVQKNRDKRIFDAVKHSRAAVARKWLADSLPPIVSSVMQPKELDQIRQKLADLPFAATRPRLTIHDILKSVGILFLVFLSTFPVAVPFIFIHDSRLSLRVSNLVALVLMFFCGWTVARYAGINKWLTGLALVLIGGLLVVVTLLLGG